MASWCLPRHVQDRLVVLGDHSTELIDSSCYCLDFAVVPVAERAEESAHLVGAEVDRPTPALGSDGLEPCPTVSSSIVGKSSVGGSAGSGRLRSATICCTRRRISVSTLRRQSGDSRLPPGSSASSRRARSTVAPGTSLSASWPGPVPARSPQPNCRNGPAIGWRGPIRRRSQRRVSRGR